jgi:PST family polysaccharide transporter
MEQNAITSAPAGLARKVVSSGLTLLGRQSAIKVIGLISGILLARVLTPQEFGIYAVASSSITLFTILGDMGFASSLLRQPTPPTHKQESTIFFAQQALYLTPAILIFALAPLIARFFHLETACISLIQVTAFCSWLASLRSIPTMKLERQLAYHVLAKVEVAQALAYNVTAITLACQGAHVWSLTAAAFASQATANLLLYIALPWRPLWHFDAQELKSRVKFGAAVQLTTIVNYARESINPLFIGRFLGPNSVGLVNFAWTTATYPIFFSSVVGRMYMPIFSQMQQDKARLTNAVRTAIRWNSFCIFGLCSVFLPTLHIIVPHIFCQKWLPALPIIYYFFCVNFFVASAWPLLTVTTAMGRSDIHLKFALANMLGLWLMAIPLINTQGLVGYGMAMVVLQVNNIWLYIASRKILPVQFGADTWRMLLATLLNMVLVAGVVRLFKLENIWFTGLLDVVGLASFALIANTLFGNSLLVEARNSISRPKEEPARAPETAPAPVLVASSK